VKSRRKRGRGPEWNAQKNWKLNHPTPIRIIFAGVIGAIPFKESFLPLGAQGERGCEGAILPRNESYRGSGNGETRRHPQRDRDVASSAVLRFGAVETTGSGNSHKESW
jgi:hypothetical protein